MEIVIVFGHYVEIVFGPQCGDCIYLCELLTAYGYYVCSQRSSLVRVHGVCFPDKIYSEMSFNISSRSKKQMLFPRQKKIGEIWVSIIILSSGPGVIKLFEYSTQLSMKFILLTNVKMPTIVGILTFISIINKTSERLKARNCVN